MSKTISLSKEIYPSQTVVQAAADYAALAAIETYEERGRIICRFSQCRYDEELTANEFLNYLVDLLNSATHA